MSFPRIACLCLTLLCGVAKAQEAAAVLERAREAAGGTEALERVEDMILTRNIHAVAGGMSGQQTVKILLPGALRQESSVPFGSFVLSLVDGQGTLQSPRSTDPLSGPQLTQAQGELLRIRERLLLADQDATLEVSFRETVTDGKREADVVDVTDSETGQEVAMFVDHETGEFYKTVYAAVALVGARELEESYSDYRDVNGVQTPFLIEVRSAGQLITRITVDKALHNTGLTKAEMR